MESSQESREDQMTSGVYAIRHIETGRCYVGSTVDMSRRWKEHKIRIKSGKHPAKHWLDSPGAGTGSRVHHSEM